MGGAGTSTSIGVTGHVLSQMSISTILQEVVVPPSQPTSFPTTLRVTQTTIGYHVPFFLLSFMLPLGNIMECQLQ